MRKKKSDDEAEMHTVLLTRTDDVSRSPWATNVAILLSTEIALLAFPEFLTAVCTTCGARAGAKGDGAVCSSLTSVPSTSDSLETEY